MPVTFSTTEARLQVTSVSKLMLSNMKKVGVVQKRLAGNAANIEASAT